MAEKTLVKAMVDSGTILSMAEGRRHIQTGAVKVDNVRVVNREAIVKEGQTITVGKHISFIV